MTSSTWKTYDTFRPLVERAIHDEQVRRSAIRAFTAARKVYDELSGEDAISGLDKLSRKDRVRDDLDTTVQSLSEAIVRMSGERRKGEGKGWLFFLVGAVVALVLFNPATGASTRRWVKDHLLGSEEEFDYATPTY
jgi:hypothetical protein